MSLRNGFKNFRQDKNGGSELVDGEPRRKTPKQVREPPSKRMRYNVCEDNMDEEEYHEAVGDLAVEWRKDKKDRSMSTVKNLFDQTSAQRRCWITNDRPLLSEVLEVFPCLSSSRFVSCCL